MTIIITISIIFILASWLSTLTFALDKPQSLSMLVRDLLRGLLPLWILLISFGCWVRQHNILFRKIAFIIIGTTGKKGLIFASQETKAQNVNVLSERLLFLFPLTILTLDFSVACFNKMFFSVTLILDTLKVKQLKSSHSP